jgi:formamidopyrimidine-DNA glycosylase
MPELPEVETTRRGIEPHVVGRRITGVIVRERRLRWPVEAGLEKELIGAHFLGARRRAKYLLLDCETGTLMVHLGMSGSLRVLTRAEPPMFHDHIDIILDSGNSLRYNDPRRFGSFHWLQSDDHPLLNHLGPEPLLDDFDAQWLYDKSRGRRASVKQFLMDGKIVVGVGNIYANEALFLAGIRPDRAAGRIALARYKALVDAVKQILSGAIQQGGTTLRDFVGGDGKPGYFAQRLNVYGRGGQPCRRCKSALKEIRQNNRATVFCSSCQR